MQDNLQINTSALAARLNFMSESDLASLADVKLSTLEAWRKRGEGPEYALLGKSYLYPLAGVESHLLSKVKSRQALSARHQIM